MRRGRVVELILWLDRTAQVDGGQELLPCFHPLAEDPKPLAGHHGDARLVHAPGGHALVRRPDEDRATDRRVTMVTLDLCTPRVFRHWCAASMTTATPNGWSTLSRQDAISAVIFSWIW